MGFYPRGEASGNKTDKGSSNSSTVLSRKLHRPDTLLFSCGATVLVGEDKVSIILRQLLFDMCIAKSGHIQAFLVSILRRVSAGRGSHSQSQGFCEVRQWRLFSTAV